MKMAKATQSDLDASLKMCNALESLANGDLPEELFDVNEPSQGRYRPREHAEKVVDHLLKLARQGSMFRVCFGMSVVLDPRNEVVDQLADTLEMHPKYQEIYDQHAQMRKALTSFVEMHDADPSAYSEFSKIAKEALPKTAAT